MNKSTPLIQKGKSVFTILMVLSLFVSTMPTFSGDELYAAPSDAAVAATPVGMIETVESVTAEPAEDQNADAEAASGPTEEADTPDLDVDAQHDETPTPTEEAIDFEQPAVPESTPDDIAPVQNGEFEVVDVTPDAIETLDQQMVAPMAVTPGGNMSGCEQSSETISPSEQIEVACTFSLTVVPFTTVTGRIERPQLPAGYTASISTSSGGNPGFSNGPGHIDFSFPRASLFGQTEVRIYITIAADNVNVPTQSFDRTFNTCMLITSNRCSIVFGQHSSIRITADFDSRQLVEGQQYAFDCTPVAPALVALDARAQSDCTIDGLAGLGDASMRLDHINWSLTGADGWEVSLSGQTLAGSSGRYVPGTLPTISQNNPHPFAVSFMPVGCPAVSSPPELLLSVQVTPVGQTTGTDTSEAKSLLASYVAPATKWSAKLTAIQDPPPTTYSMTKPDYLKASFTAEYTVSGCSAWTGDAQMSSFTHSTDPQVSTVPLLESVTPGATTITGSGATTVNDDDIETSTTAPILLISGTAPGQQVTVEQVIHLEYKVPANTPVGTYESTITVSMPAAP